jgi:PAS domain S-box-containing protein
VGYVTLDRHGRVEEANLTASSLLKIERTYLIGLPFPCAVALHDRAAFREHLRRCFAERRRATSELSMTVRGRGSVVLHVTSTPSIAHDGTVETCRTTLTDITALKQSELRLRSLADASLALGASLATSDTLATVARIAVPSLADRCHVDIVDESGQLRRLGMSAALPADTLQARVVETGEAIHFSDGPSMPSVKGAAAPTRSVLVVPLEIHGQTIGTLTLAIVETDRRFSDGDVELAKELAHRTAIALDNARRYEAAQSAIRAREDILAIVAHDLRNPLGSILLSADLLLGASPRNERRRGRKQLEAIRRGAMRMERMIGDLLDMSSIEAGHLAIDRAIHAVRDLVTDVTETFAPIAAKNGRSWRSHPTSRTWASSATEIECVRSSRTSSATRSSSRRAEASYASPWSVPGARRCSRCPTRGQGSPSRRCVTCSIATGAPPRPRRARASACSSRRGSSRRTAERSGRRASSESAPRSASRSPSASCRASRRIPCGCPPRASPSSTRSPRPRASSWWTTKRTRATSSR